VWAIIIVVVPLVVDVRSGAAVDRTMLPQPQANSGAAAPACLICAGRCNGVLSASLPL